MCATIGGGGEAVAWRLAEFRTLERFRTPRTFNPNLSFPEACVAVSGALARIFLGSMVFGVCGGLAWYSWANIANSWMRFSTVFLLTVMFLVSFTALMIGIQLAVDGMMTRVRPQKHLS
jgi:hypothetical protein